MAQAARQLSPRAEDTRSSILEAAERLFAARGFDKTRLEDVAEAVGIRRASIVYYFKDKQVVYDEVLARVFGEFRERLEEALETDGPMANRIEAAVSAWVDYVGGRPSFARILLREVADGAHPDRARLLSHIEPFRELVQDFLDRHRDDPLLKRATIDPAHMAATIAGATVFFVAAMPALIPETAFDPLSEEHLEAHQLEVIKITRRLMREGD